MSFSKYVIDFADKLESGKFTKELMSDSEQLLHNMIAMLIKDSLKSEAGVLLMDRIYSSWHEAARKSEEFSRKCESMAGKIKDLESNDEASFAG